MKVIELQGVTNVRDLGGIPVGEGRIVVPGLFYRGGALADATDGDCRILFDDLGIRHVVDVRCGWERREKPDVEVSGVENMHIPFYDLDIVGIEYTEPAAGTKTIGRDVACNPERFYRSLSNPLTVGQMRQGVQTLFAKALESSPTYVHCSGGKDRAGIMSLLVLTALGASREAILEDYLYTNVARDKDYEKNYARFLQLAGGDKKLARELTESHRARPENLAAFYEVVDASYGSMDSFVSEQLGLDEAALARVREHCTTRQ